VPIQPEPIATLPEAPAAFGGHEGGERRDHRRIPPRPLHARPIVRRPTQAHGAAGLLNWKAIHGHEVRDDLPPFRRP